MRFKNFIVELGGTGLRGEGNFSVTEKSDPEWAYWVRQNCRAYLARANAHPIYRGFDDSFDKIPLALKDTNTFTRRSANTANYYTLWMDNAPAWKDYPRRSKSYIASTSYYAAGDFGIPFRLFPAADARIGVCPADDLWQSFGIVPGYDLGGFALALERGFENLYSREIARGAMLHWDNLKALLKDTSIETLADAAFRVEGRAQKEAQLANFRGLGPNLIDYFENYLIPEGHGFKVFTGATFASTSHPPREVWVQGNVALLNMNTFSAAAFPETAGLLEEFKIVLP